MTTQHKPKFTLQDAIDKLGITPQRIFRQYVDSQVEVKGLGIPMVMKRPVSDCCLFWCESLKHLYLVDWSIDSEFQGLTWQLTKNPGHKCRCLDHEQLVFWLEDLKAVCSELNEDTKLTSITEYASFFKWDSLMKQSRSWTWSEIAELPGNPIEKTVAKILLANIDFPEWRIFPEPSQPSMTHWTGDSRKIKLIGDDKSDSQRVISITKEENNLIRFREECDECFVIRMDKDQAREALQEALEWLDR